MSLADQDNSELNVTPRDAMKNAIGYLNSIYSTPSVIEDTSFHRPQVESTIDQSGIHADSILGTFSPHSSFMAPNETSVIAPARKRRKSIRDSEYASLLVSEGNPVSSYSSLLRDSLSTAQDARNGISHLSWPRVVR